MNSSILSPLGQKSQYVSQYQQDLLFPIQRIGKRNELNIGALLPFKGFDIWNAYELSWLNQKGKPQIVIAQFIVPCESICLIESKSLKLYLNSFNNTHFSSALEVKNCIEADLSHAVQDKVTVHLMDMSEGATPILPHFSGTCLDDLDLACDVYQVTPDFLETEDTVVTEVVYSDLLKSNCLVTGQPDWGSIQLSYTGKKIQHEGLLKYIISFRNHDEFHEQCVERIFIDVLKYCAPTQLSVYARYTRRGGLDINPFRSTEAIFPENKRLARQ